MLSQTEIATSDVRVRTLARSSSCPRDRNRTIDALNW